MIRIVESGMFLLPYSASLILSKMDTSLKQILLKRTTSCALIVQFQQASNCSKATIKTRKRYKICFNLIIKTPKRRHSHNLKLLKYQRERKYLSCFKAIQNNQNNYYDQALRFPLNEISKSSPLYSLRRSIQISIKGVGLL